MVFIVSTTNCSDSRPGRQVDSELDFFCKYACLRFGNRDSFGKARGALPLVFFAPQQRFKKIIVSIGTWPFERGWIGYAALLLSVQIEHGLGQENDYHHMGKDT